MIKPLTPKETVTCRGLFGEYVIGIAAAGAVALTLTACSANGGGGAHSGKEVHV
jgi:hypothetical protein